MHWMRNEFLFVVAMCLALRGFGQEDTSWTFGGQGQLNFSQAAFVNWAAGGQNTLALTGIVDLSADYHKGKKTWENSLSMAYGQTKLGPDWRKSEDALELTSKFGHSLSKVWQASSLLEFKTQFAPGYNFPNDSVIVSKALAPAFANLSVGFDYKPADFFSLYLSPIGAKWIYVGDTMTVNQEVYGVESGNKLRSELGATVKMTIKKEVLKNVTVNSNVLLFSNYLENPQNVDIDWQMTIGMKVNEFISASVSTQLIYDDNILIPKTTEAGVPYQGKGTQFKEVLAIGLTYKL